MSATVCWIDARASPTCDRSSSILFIWPTCTFHQSANSRTRASVFGPMPPIRIGMRPPTGAAPAVRRAAGDSSRRSRRPHRPTGRARPRASRGVDRRARGLDRADTERRELLAHRTPSDAELEAAAGRVVDRHRLTREHGRVAERVAEHERSDPQSLGVRGEPRRRDDRFEHRLVVRQRWNQVVHAGDPDETARFGGTRARDQSSNDNRICGRNRLNSIAAKPSVRYLDVFSARELLARRRGST